MATTAKQVLAELKALGDEAVVKRNKKNGAGDNQFGCKMGDLRKVAAKLKHDPKLALALWKSGNIDARLLAVLLLKPEDLDNDQLDQWVRDANFPQLADWLNSYLVKTHPGREELRQTWMEDADPWAARAGWSLTAGRVARDPKGIDLPKLLKRIETEMPGADPAAQWTMNTCLAQIGIHHEKHRKRAIAIGEKLGIYRDYPTSKGCTSPFAPIWIAEMVKRQG